MPYQPDPSLAAFLAELPKTETHLHIEGALPYDLLRKKDPQKYAKVPDSWADDFKFSDFTHFESELLGYAGDWYDSAAAYKESATIVFERLYREQQVRYVETSFASGVMEFMKLDGEEVAAAIKAAAPKGMEVKVFMGIHHDGYHEDSIDMLESSLDWPLLDGIDLHGTESVPVGDWAIPFWEKARSKGKRTKAHAGEFCGPEFVRWVVDDLKVRRIQHGVRSIEDKDCVQDLIAKNVVLDVCPISNVKLNVVDRMENHPIRKLFDAGVICTVNTDDPISFGNQLHEEYTALNQVLGFTIPELAQIAKNGFLTADMPDEWKAVYLKEIDRLATAHG